MPHCVLTLKLIGEWWVTALPLDTQAPPSSPGSLWALPHVLLATLSPQATSRAPISDSTHTFSLCSGLAMDYFDGGKDQVSCPPSAEGRRKAVVTRGGAIPSRPHAQPCDLLSKD